MKSNSSNTNNSSTQQNLYSRFVRHFKDSKDINLLFKRIDKIEKLFTMKSSKLSFYVNRLLKYSPNLPLIKEMKSRIEIYNSLSKKWCEELITAIQRNISEEMKKEKDLLGIVDIESEPLLDSEINSQSSPIINVENSKLTNSEFNLKKSSKTKLRNITDSSFLKNKSEPYKVLNKDSLNQTQNKSTQTDINLSIINEGYEQKTPTITATKSETFSLPPGLTQQISDNKDRDPIFKRKVPTFSGEFEKAYDCFIKFRDIANYNQWTDEEKVKYARLFLRGPAEDWYIFEIHTGKRN